MKGSSNTLNVNSRKRGRGQATVCFLFPSQFSWCSLDRDGLDFVPLHHFLGWSVSLRSSTSIATAIVTTTATTFCRSASCKGVPFCPMFPPSARSYECGAGGVRVCCINATVVCVNVLMFGPPTANMLVSDCPLTDH